MSEGRVVLRDWLAEKDAVRLFDVGNVLIDWDVVSGLASRGSDIAVTLMLVCGGKVSPLVNATNTAAEWERKDVAYEEALAALPEEKLYAGLY